MIDKTTLETYDREQLLIYIEHLESQREWLKEENQNLKNKIEDYKTKNKKIIKMLKE